MRRLFLLLTAALMLFGCATAGAATSPLGSRTFDQAFDQAAPGDVITVPAGTYGGQSISGSKTSPVTLEVADGVTLTGGLSITATNVTVKGPGLATNLNVSGGAKQVVVDGWTFDRNGTKGEAGYIASVDGVTIRNSEFRDNIDQSLVFLDAGPGIHVQNVTFDHDVFHDALTVTAGIHTECLYGGAGKNVTIRNSTFYRCRTMDVFVTGAASGQYQASDWTIENNLFRYSIMPDGTPHSYGLKFYSDYPLNGFLIRNNTLEQDLSLPTNVAAAPSAIYSNAVSGSISCRSGIAYGGNVVTGNICGSDKKVTALGLDAAWRPVSGSPLIDAGDMTHSTVTDLDGRDKVGARDSGAYESGSTPAPPPPPPDPTPTPTPTVVCADVPECVSLKQQVADLQAALTTATAYGDQAAADLAAMTDSRDAWKARAVKAEDQVARIKVIAGE